jgi:hypothetical protein
MLLAAAVEAYPYIGDRNRRMMAWLSSSDPLDAHEKAYGKHQIGTCQWFFRSSGFTTWLSDDLGFLWLSGFREPFSTTMLKRTNCREQLVLGKLYFCKP